MQTDHQSQQSQAVDAPKERRPGVPMARAAHPVANAHWTKPDRQPVSEGVIKDAGRAEFTSTFGTGQKPRGVSGALRKAAYRIPDYRVRRWLMLLIADRIDALEAHWLR
jgi:hypothetical protein